MATSESGKRFMTQSAVINHLAEKTGMSRAQVRRVLEELADLARREINTGGEFVLPGFGKWVLRRRAARQGRNPRTGEALTIPPRIGLRFSISKALKSSLAGDPTTGDEP